jgi:DNA replication licensing factor MCM5
MEFKEFAQRPDAYVKLCSMIGPSIYGHADVKKAIACLLFGGSKKVFDLIQWLMCFW